MSAEQKVTILFSNNMYSNYFTFRAKSYATFLFHIYFNSCKRLSRTFNKLTMINRVTHEFYTHLQKGP